MVLLLSECALLLIVNPAGAPGAGNRWFTLSARAPGLQGWAAAVPVSLSAGAEQVSQAPPYPLEVLDPPFDVSQPGHGLRLDIRAARARRQSELEQLCDFPQGKPELLRALDKRDPGDGFLRELPVAGRGARRLRDQPLPLVEAHGFNANAGALRDTPDRKPLSSPCRLN